MLFENAFPSSACPHFWEKGGKVVAKIMGWSPTRGIKERKNQYFVSAVGLFPHIEAAAEKPAAALFFAIFL